MKRMLVGLFVLFLGYTGMAQTISGTVKDTKGKPVPSVSIALKDSYDGATTDSSGTFSFTTTEKGSPLLTATAIGYKLFENPIVVSTGVQQIAIVLKEEITELKAVVISAGAFEASDRKKGTVLS